MSDADRRPIALLVVASLIVRSLTAVVVAQPGYTDAYYYADVASRLARGLGLTADFAWGPLELGALPVTSHRFWMPLASVLQAAGITVLGPFVGDFRAGQAAIIVVAALVPAAAYVAARALGANLRAALVGAAVVGLGGLFAPAWVSVDGFAPAALLGTLFFLAYARAATGSLRAGIVAGLLVGLLYLARAEGALFGLPLLALTLRAPSRSAGLAGSLVALAIGGAWLARDAAAGLPPGLFSRTVFLVRYEDFFAVQQPSVIQYLTSPELFTSKIAALVTNAATFVFAFALVLVVPLAAGIRALWDRSEARAWSLLALLVFGAQSLVWTLHSTRGSYFHSLAAFFPFGTAIAVVGGERLLATRRPEVAAAWAWGTVLLVATTSGFALVQWDAAFNAGARVRAAAVSAIPDGAFLAIDAAAWRWISGRSVAFTPSDGLSAAACVASTVNARSIVLEEAHFRAYDALYRGGARPAWLGPPIERDTIKIFPIVGELDLRCGGGP